MSFSFYFESGALNIDMSKFIGCSIGLGNTVCYSESSSIMWNYFYSSYLDWTGSLTSFWRGAVRGGTYWRDFGVYYKDPFLWGFWLVKGRYYCSWEIWGFVGLALACLLYSYDFGFVSLTGIFSLNTSEGGEALWPK